MKVYNTEALRSDKPEDSKFYRTAFLSCAKLTPIQYVERTTGAKVGEEKLVFHKDTHGGFHGDGHTLIVIDCSLIGTDFESSLIEWRELPMSDKLHDEIFNNHDFEADLNDMSFCSYLFKNNDLPSVKNGLYFLNNRHDKAVSRDDEDLDYYSSNYTFALYDRDTKILYYIDVDT